MEKYHKTTGTLREDLEGGRQKNYGNEDMGKRYFLVPKFQHSGKTKLCKTFPRFEH